MSLKGGRAKRAANDDPDTSLSTARSTGRCGLEQPSGKERRAIAMNASQRERICSRLLRKYGEFCFYCQIPLSAKAATIDHYIPKSVGGSNNIENLRPACFDCNNDKADRVPNADGSIPPRVVRQRNRKCDRPAMCNNCQNGRLLRADEWCPLCETGPQPLIRPQYLKRRCWECDHDQSWCISCCLATDSERFEMALAVLERELVS